MSNKMELTSGLEDKGNRSKLENFDDDRISYDEALVKYGSGRFLLLQYVLLVFVTWATAINNVGYVFMGANQKHTCLTPFVNVSDNSLSENETIIYITDQCTYDRLVRYDNGTNVTLEEGVKCESWDYDQSEFTLTIMSEWNINSCTGDKWMISFASSMYMIGFLIGCIVLADLSDRFGRSTMLLVSNVLMFGSGLAASYSINLPMLIVMRFVMGVFTAGARNAAFSHVNEITSVKYRSAAGVLTGFFYTLGSVFVTALAQFIPNWRQFQLACACVYLAGIPLYWLIPESPRWRLSMGDQESAKRYFKRSARFSGITFPKELEVYLEFQPKKEGNVLTLFKTPNIRNKTLISCVLWFSVSIVYFGMVFNIGNIGGNIFLNNYIMTSGGVFSIIGIWYIEWGRRNSAATAFFLASALSVTVAILAHYEVNSIVIAVMCMLGASSIGVTFTAMYISTAEIYPTTVRVTALGLGSALARSGGALSPYIVYSNGLWPNMPYVIFGVIAFLAGILATKLPETKGKTIPDSLYQAENEVPLSNFMWCGGGSSGEHCIQSEDDTAQKY